MLSPDHHTRMALVGDRRAELLRRSATADARRAASLAPAFKSRRLRLHRLALVRRAAHAA